MAGTVPVNIPNTSCVTITSGGSGYSYTMGSGISSTSSVYGYLTYPVSSTLSINTITGDIITLTNPTTGKLLFGIDKDCKIIWGEDVEISEAANVLENCISLSIEQKAGIKEMIKRKIRDSVFEELIEIAENKGSLTSNDIKLILEGTKIMEKLKDD